MTAESIEPDEENVVPVKRNWPKSGQSSIPLDWLVEDWTLYPRHQLDGSNVRDLTHALEASDELPRIIVENGTGRIIDGFHRRRAYLRYYDNDVTRKVPVILKDYADDGEAFADAVRYNRSHGRKLNSNDVISSVHRLRDYGVDDNGIALILKVPESYVEEIAIRIALSETQEPVPLKAGDRHLQGQTLDHDQIEALTHRQGVPYGRLARQLIDAAKNNLLPDDSSFWAVLQELHQVIGEALNKQG
jgi:hypothetical protein